MTYVLAVDMGASGGRHILAHLEEGKIVLEEIYRFDNVMVERERPPVLADGPPVGACAQGHGRLQGRGKNPGFHGH